MDLAPGGVDFNSDADADTDTESDIDTESDTEGDGDFDLENRTALSYPTGSRSMEGSGWPRPSIIM